MAPIEAPEEQQSLFHIERISQYVCLPPSSLQAPLPAICASVFSPLLLSYFPPARGVVLAYENVQLSDSPPTSSQPTRPRQNDQPLLLRQVDEYSAPFLWATADFLVWRPEFDVWMTARLVHQSSTHITLSYLNSFTVSVVKQCLPDSWTWISTPSSTYSMTGGSRELSSSRGAHGVEGYWADADGMATMSIGGEVSVRIRDWTGATGKGKGYLSVDGSLLTKEEEQSRREEDRSGRAKKSAKSAKGVLRKSKSAEADASVAENLE